MKIEIVNNEIELVIQVCAELYPEIGTAKVYFMGAEQAGAAGYSQKNGNEWMIGVNDEIPYRAVSEIIAHEVAHIVKESRKPSGDDMELHNEEWEQIFEDISAEFEKRAVELQKSMEGAL